ncbi:hypothetical protein [Pelagicoccus mobilis]|uniref:Uncharacterized protein n=1 Tax=Pelagicoccus mobilis TaxID=415221 RepID=A0A934VL45_9BACT|nr:hypothetical protein [Pelagicoccus mobilis]MBK1877371.1 hypothetical protein [Pelagicoccus mobilis]
MTDGQSFYLVLSIFYLIECIKLAPPGSIALVGRTGAFGRCAPRPPLMMAWGLKKTVFIAPFLPWPGAIYLVSSYTEKRKGFGRISTVSGIRRHQKLIQDVTRKLRPLAVINLINFFLLLPLVYIRTYDEGMILLTLAYSYATQFGTALHYRVLHKRLLPSFEADRLKTTLYTALLPWHAPRCYDELTLRCSLRWDPIAALAANAADKATLALLQQHWRNAHFLPKPEYPAPALAAAFKQVDLDPSDWLDAPKTLDGSLYCPCCHSGYTPPATHCADCKGVELVKA